MKISSIKSAEKQTSFSAHLVTRNKEMSSFVNQMKKNLDDANLLQGITDAFENYPEKGNIRLSFIKKNGLWAARGVVSTRFATFIDSEPANNNRIHPIKNILRRILDPENKDVFNKLMGGKHSDSYNTWWEENISPFWNDINTKFREKTFFDGNYDKEFNLDFRNQQERAWQRIFVSEKN